MKISVTTPIKNEVDWIGYSIMAAAPWVHEFIYAVSPSDDGTLDLLNHLSGKLGPKKIVIIPFSDFDPHNRKEYNEAFNVCIREMTGDVAWFLHPDQIVTKGAVLQEGPLAWTVEMKSFARDMNTVITKGRSAQWKNLHVKKFGLHYSGGYGSQNEDFYHAEITGNTYKHYGTEYSKYPYEVAPSGIEVNHYCEVRSYDRRLMKMKLCLEEQIPTADKRTIEEMATQHPRVTLEQSSSRFGTFEFQETNEPIPDVFSKYKAEFEPFKKELVHG